MVSDHGTAAEGKLPDKTSFSTRIEDISHFPEWAKIALLTSRKVVDISESLVLDLKMSPQFAEASRKEFAMLFAGKILEIAAIGDFRSWASKYNNNYQPMPARGILDVKSRLPAAEAAVRLAPNGGHESVDEREKTGFIRGSRK